MRKIFLNKKLTYLLLALTMVVLLLLFILITSLGQIASINAKVSELQRLIAEVENGTAEQEELLEYRKSNEYLINWAIEIGLVKEEDTVWQEK